MTWASDHPFEIDGDDDFRESVESVLKAIASYPTGQAVLAEFAREGRVKIVPYEEGDFNAKTGGPKGVRAKLSRLYNGGIVPGATVQFSASVFSWSATSGGKPPLDPRVLFPGMRADEILLHELVHALNELGPGRDMSKPTGAMAPYGTYDDFYAIMVTNIYQSEKGNTPPWLRNSHALTPIGMPGWEAISEIFLFKDGHYPWVEKYCEQHNHLAHLLARSPANFNPLRSYFTLRNEPDKEGGWPTPQIQSPPGDGFRPHAMQTAHNTRMPVTDSKWLELLTPRFQANDVKGYGARAQQVKDLAAYMSATESLPMHARLLLQPPGDRVAKMFHDHLSTPLRNAVLAQLRSNMKKR